MPFSLYSADFKDQPYWWDAAPRPLPREAPLPGQVDVAVIGSGYTGLQAALQTARGGRQTLVLDAEAAGWGCSSRNGGQLDSEFKPSHAELARRYGAARALEIGREGMRALDYVGDFVRQEGLDCGYERVGRFHAAHHPTRYEQLAREMQAQPAALRMPFHMVPRAEQHCEIATDAYFGGCVMEAYAALDPARYHLEMLRVAEAAGVQVASHTPVTGIAAEGRGFRLQTARGAVTARDVVVATNGYTGTVTPWQRRRVIPIGSYIIATEELAPELTARLLPNARVISDTRKVVYYYRLSPDRRRVVFGGRVAFDETDVRISAPRLHRDMVAVFPELAATRVSHAWMGFVAFTFDHLPHAGRHAGIHYAMGYCGSGIALASYLGMRIGQQVLGSSEGATALDGLAFQTRPTYTGRPWFLGPSIAWYKLRDRMPF